MRARLHFVIVLLLAGVAEAQVADRMVAVVNKRVILESDLDQATRVEFLMQAKPIERLTHADRAAVMEPLIDRSLLDQQIVNPAMLDPAPEELKTKIEELRQSIPGGSKDESWKTILA